MTQSLSCARSTRSSSRTRAIGYTPGADGQPRTLMGNLEYDGSSNFVTTTRDLAKWDGNFYAPTVGGQALVDAMRVRGKLSDGTVLDYAMGLEVEDNHGVPEEWHNGSFMGYRSTLARFPTQRLAVSGPVQHDGGRSRRARPRRSPRCSCRSWAGPSRTTRPPRRPRYPSRSASISGRSLARTSIRRWRRSGSSR